MKDRCYLKTGRNISQKTETEIYGYGVAFLKSGMADFKIKQISETLEELGRELGAELFDVVVDGSAGRDIDRKAIDDLCYWVENAPVSLVILNSLDDITDDPDDLDKFIYEMTAKDVMILSITENRIYMPDSYEEICDEG